MSQNAIKQLFLENDESSHVKFSLTVEDLVTKEHIRLAEVLDSKLAFESEFESIWGTRVREYDFSGRRFSISLPELDQAASALEINLFKRITVWGVSMDTEDLQLGKDEFLLMVDVLEQEKVRLENMPRLPSFNDLMVKDLLFDANRSMKFSYSDDLMKETDARLRFIEKSDCVNDGPMGISLYDRDMCIFGNKLTFEYMDDRCAGTEIVEVTGIHANAQRLDTPDEFLHLVNLLVDLQASERLLQRNEAVAMGCNPRLGQNSLLADLEEGILRQIIEIAEENDQPHLEEGILADLDEGVQ